MSASSKWECGRQQVSSCLPLRDHKLCWETHTAHTPTHAHTYCSRRAPARSTAEVSFRRRAAATTGRRSASRSRWAGPSGSEESAAARCGETKRGATNCHRNACVQCRTTKMTLHAQTRGVSRFFFFFYLGETVRERDSANWTVGDQKQILLNPVMSWKLQSELLCLWLQPHHELIWFLYGLPIDFYSKTATSWSDTQLKCPSVYDSTSYC